jgi:hypothetical protein
MFKALIASAPEAHITIQIDGHAHRVAASLNAATAVLMTLTDERYRDGPLDQARAPYCMMGVCFECLLTINGQPNQQGCLVTVEPGMRIERQVAVQ